MKRKKERKKEKSKKSKKGKKKVENERWGGGGFIRNIQFNISIKRTLWGMG